MSIIPELLDLITEYLSKKSDKILNKIKALLRYFKLLFRVNYSDFIDKLIDICKLRIIEILEVIP